MTNRISDPTNGAFGTREAEWPQPTPDELDEFLRMLESIPMADLKHRAFGKWKSDGMPSVSELRDITIVTDIEIRSVTPPRPPKRGWFRRLINMISGRRRDASRASV